MAQKERINFYMSEDLVAHLTPNLIIVDLMENIYPETFTRQTELKYISN